MFLECLHFISKNNSIILKGMEIKKISHLTPPSLREITRTLHYARYFTSQKQKDILHFGSFRKQMNLIMLISKYLLKNHYSTIYS